MPVHLYGVLSAEAMIASSTRGLDGRPVRALLLGGRCAWVSDITEPTLEATPQRLREHDAVLRDAVVAEHSVMPALFGRMYADDTSLANALEQSAESLNEGMALVRGRVEMSFLVASSRTFFLEEHDELRESTTPGREHLRRIRSRIHAERILRDKASELVHSATRVLGELLVAERVVEDPAAPVLAARAHLVAREDVARYLRAVRSEARSADPALRVTARGPGAAYSFAAVRIG